MSAAVSNIGWPLRKTQGVFAQRLNACFEILVGHFVLRAAIETLRELDDRALRDIGLDRTKIEAAVAGLVVHSKPEQVS